MKYIELTKGKQAMVDDEDYDRLINMGKWHFNYTYKNQGYAGRVHNGKLIRMHRFLMGAEKGEIIDHIDGNTLNNQKKNLRLVEPYQNTLNQTSYKNKGKSKYRGVYWCNSRNIWRAHIYKKRKHYTIGSFQNEEDAARAYNEKAKELHGEFANLNEIN